MNNETLDIHEAAALMNIHPETVLGLISKGMLPAGKIGRPYVLLKKDVMIHIERVIIQQTAARMGPGPLPKRVRRASRISSLR